MNEFDPAEIVGLGSDDSAADVSPRTQSLSVYIQEAVVNLRQRSRLTESPTRDKDGLLFLGNWHDSHPRLLFHDGTLEPVDKVVWAVIRHHVDVNNATAFPTYQTIGRCANIRSKATVARSIMLLRVTRWLSLCARVRDGQGRYQGNVYALHDEPISLVDAVYLDPGYRQFLQQMRSYKHDRVRQIADALWRSQESPEKVPQKTVPMTASDPNAVQNLNRSHQVQNLNLVDHGRVQNLNSVGEVQGKQEDSGQVQNLNPALCSSSEKNTTTAQPGEKNVQGHLVFPLQFSPEERHLADRHLSLVPEDIRQDVLDELQGRLLHRASSQKPVNNPLGYLMSLCQATQTGRFVLTSAGLQARQTRRQQRQHQKLLDQHSAPPLPETPAKPCALARKLLDIRDRQRRRHAAEQDLSQDAPGVSESAQAEYAVKAGGGV